MPRKFHTVTATAPAEWASYLINGDASGIDDSDREQADAFCERALEGYNASWFAPSDIGEPEFCHTCDARSWGLINVACDAAEYTFVVPVGDDDDSGVAS